MRRKNTWLVTLLVVMALIGSLAYWQGRGVPSKFVAAARPAAGIEKRDPSPVKPSPEFSVKADSHSSDASLIARGSDHTAILAVRSFLEQGNTKQALELLQQEISLHPDDDVFAEEMAMLQLRLGDVAAAEVWLRKTLQLNPRNEVAMGELSEWLSSTGRVDEAIGILQALSASCGTACPAVNLALGELLKRSGEFEQAAAEFKQAGSESTVREAALRQLALMQAKNAEKSAAVATLEEVVAMKQKSIRSLQAQGVDTQVLESSLQEDVKKILELRKEEG